MQVVFSQAAERDLLGIAIYIAEDSPLRARTFVDEIEAYARGLSEAPHRGAKRTRLAAGLRLLVHGHYNIYYRVEAEKVQVLRILHAARRIRRKDFG